MASGAQLSVPELRRATRHPVDYTVIGEHRTRGDVTMHIANISAQGFLVDDAPQLQRGDRITVALPGIGRIEAYAIWVTQDRAGLQFERVLRLDDFLGLIDKLQPNPRLRRRR